MYKYILGMSWYFQPPHKSEKVSRAFFLHQKLMDLEAEIGSIHVVLP